MTKTKNYKPGQLLTIRGRLYRIKRAKPYVYTCLFCDANRTCIRLRGGKIVCHDFPTDCYLQLVTPKFSDDDKD